MIRLELTTRVRTGLRLVCLAVSVDLVGRHTSAQSLRGSRGALDLQTAQAVSHDFTYLGGAGQLRRFVAAGYLVPVDSNRDYWLKDVSFPVARPEVRLFIGRLASQYRRACGERLVVTSLTRPLSHQPRNASDRSVHPTGMALDLRRPAGRCRRWLERTLLSLESRGVLEATAERHPPHYHVAVFPEHYASYVDKLTGLGASGLRVSLRSHTVRRGDTLWQIARQHDTSPRALRQANRLSSNRIHPGQRLTVP